MLIASALPSVQLVDASDAAVITACACSILFIIWYTIKAPWWRYRVGRAFVSLDAALAAALLPSTIRLIFHVHSMSLFFIWYAMLSLFVVSGVTLWRAYTVGYVQTHSESGEELREDEV